MSKYLVTFINTDVYIPISVQIVSFPNVDECGLWASMVCKAIYFDTGVHCSFIVKGLSPKGVKCKKE